MGEAVEGAVAAEVVHAAAGAVDARVEVARARAVVRRGVAVDHAILRRVRRRCHGHQLRTFAGQVAGRWQTAGRRWVICRRPEVAPALELEIGRVQAMLRGVRILVLDPAEATLPIDRGRVRCRTRDRGQAQVQVRSPETDRALAHARRHATYKTFSICRMPAVGMSAAAGRRVD